MPLEELFLFLHGLRQIDFVVDIHLAAAFENVVAFFQIKSVVVQNGKNIGFRAQRHQIWFRQDACKLHGVVGEL